GSITATFFQGVTLGAYIDGIPIANGAYAGGPLDWLRPFPVFTGLGLVMAYTLLGCTWLVFKTEGLLQRRMVQLARPLTLGLLVVIIVLSLRTPMAHPHIADRWFSMPNLLWFAPVPVLVALTAYALLRSLRDDPHGTPFVLTRILVFLGYSG